jgi:cycloartenol synthase
MKQYDNLVSQRLKTSLPFSLQLAKENNFSLVQKGKAETPVDINPNTVSQILRKALSYFSAIQAHDGHWPGDFPGPLFTTATMVKVDTSYFYFP